MLRQLQDETIFTRNDVLNYIGSRFRIKLQLPEWYSDIDCANYLFKYSLFTHLDENMDKFNLLMFVTSSMHVSIESLILILYYF